MRHRSKKWGVGFDQHVFGRAPLRRFAHIVCGFERDDARKRKISTPLYASACFWFAASEAMEDGSWRRALRIKHIEGVVPRFARVNNKRQVQFVRKLYLLCESFTLNCSVRMVVVIIKAAFTNANNIC